MVFSILSIASKMVGIFQMLMVKSNIFKNDAMLKRNESLYSSMELAMKKKFAVDDMNKTIMDK